MSENNKKLSDVEQADQFIQRLHDLEIIFRPISKKEKELTKFSHEISRVILEYQEADSVLKPFYARFLLFWVNKAYTMGFIAEGEGLKKKITELKQKNESLQDRLEECIERCEQLEKEKRDLEDYYRDRDGGSIVGNPFE
jgi:DNA repair exonuclease SbcCD ATPase subunit